MKHTQIITLIASILTLFAAPALAQDDPREILANSAQALNDTPGFSAKATLSGTGSQMILSTLPSMTARMTMGTHPDHGRVIHLLGELRPTTQAPPETFDILYSAEKLIWADHPKATLFIRPPSVSARQKPPAYKYLMLAEIIDDTPFQQELDTAQAIDLEPTQSIAGTDCHVILITRAAPKRGARSTSSGHTKERWYIGQQDNLPRRVEQITDGGLINATLIMELSEFSVAPQSESDLEVFKPESYKVSDTTKAQQPKPTIPDQKTDTNPGFNKPNQPATNTKPAPPKAPIAPNYTFTDTNANTITRDTQAGKITALYFFGSWSIPSKQANPLYSSLASDFQNQSSPDASESTEINTFAIAMREADPEALIEYHSDNDYAQTLAINPESNLAALFQVRVYPTIVITNQENRIVFRESISKDRKPQDLIDRARTKITELQSELQAQATP